MTNFLPGGREEYEDQRDDDYNGPSSFVLVVFLVIFIIGLSLIAYYGGVSKRVNTNPPPSPLDINESNVTIQAPAGH